MIYQEGKEGVSILPVIVTAPHLIHSRDPMDNVSNNGRTGGALTEMSIQEMAATHDTPIIQRRLFRVQNLSCRTCSIRGDTS